MQNPKLSVAGLPGMLAEIQCEPLMAFDRTDRENVRRAFRSAVACPFEQAWLSETEVGFSPGEVRLGWRGGSLLVFAELTDRDIFNRATELNQPLWELGDVFEMFFKSDEMESYVEIQVAPQNQRLQLSQPHARTAEWTHRREEFTNCLLWDEVFHSQTWVEAEMNRWQVYAEIPARMVCGSNEPMENTQWRFSFGRYDYTRGVTDPVISSTSPHIKPDFHRQHEWGVLTFNNSLVIVNR
jgi:hypothetical protein